jgi:DNA repair protein RadC
MKLRFKTQTFLVQHTSALSLGTAECAEDVVPLLRAIFRDACDADREHFVVLALDARLRIIGYKLVASGTLSACLVHVRDVLGVAFAFRGCGSILVAHSHPSQDPTPSDADFELTERLVDAGDLLGIPVVDHIVVASSGADDATWRSAMSPSRRSRAFKRPATSVR